MPGTVRSQPPCSAILLLPEIASDPALLRKCKLSTKHRGAVSARALQVLQFVGLPSAPAVNADSCNCRVAAIHGIAKSAHRYFIGGVFLIVARAIPDLQKCEPSINRS